MFAEYLMYLCYKIMFTCSDDICPTKCSLIHDEYIINGLSNLVTPIREVTLADFQGRV